MNTSLSHPLRLLAVLIAMLATTAPAATVSITLNSNAGPWYTSSGGALLPFGSVIRVGFFDLANPATLAILQASNDLATVDSFFTPLAEGEVNGGSVTQTGAPGQQIIVNNSFGAGHAFGQITGIESTYLTTGADLAVWVFNSSTPAAATEWGIFSATSGWDFPNGLGSETISTSEINQVVRGTADLGNNAYQLASIAPVPEPGSGLAVLLGIGFMLRRRRR